MKRLKLQLALMMILSFLFAGSVVHAESAGGYILPGSSNEYVTDAQVAGMNAQVACYALNEIYARNGRMFESAELQNYFQAQYWYTPIYEAGTFSDTQLNAYETDNAAVLKQLMENLGGYQLDQEGYSYDTVYTYLTSQAESNASVDAYYVDPNSYIFYDSDKRYLEESEISCLSLQELCYAKNEIYARRGLIFSSAELSNYFGQKYWYQGMIQPADAGTIALNEYESANVDLLTNTEFSKEENGYLLDQPQFTYKGIGAYTSPLASAAADTDTSGEEYIFPDSNARYLTAQDVQGMTLQNICYAKNEIYARRGCIFQKQELRDYFSSKSWYHGTVPSASFSSTVFNEFEAGNIEFLKNIEYGYSPDGYQLY